MWRHYVYIHRKASDGTPFYVGKGTVHKRTKNMYGRACEPHLNNHWQNIVNKHGLLIEIVASCQNDKEAQNLEKLFIEFIGRYDLGKGPLVNLTDGGDGCCGLIISDEVRKGRSIRASAPRSQAWIDAVRIARKNGGNGDVVKHGDKLPKEWRDNLAKGKMGSKNPYYGKTTKIARKVIDDITKEIYPSVSKAAEDYKLNMKSLYNMLSGHRSNFTALRFYDGV